MTLTTRCFSLIVQPHSKHHAHDTAWISDTKNGEFDIGLNVYLGKEDDEYLRLVIVLVTSKQTLPMIGFDLSHSYGISLFEHDQIDHPKHDYLAPHGGRRVRVRFLFVRSDIPLRPGISTTPKKWFENGIHTSKLVNSAMLPPRHLTKLTPFGSIAHFQHPSVAGDTFFEGEVLE